MNNQDLLNMMGVSKSDGGMISISNTSFGDILPREQVREIIDLTTSHDQWLKEISSFSVSLAKGTVPVVHLHEPAMEYVGDVYNEQDTKSVTTKLPTRNVPYLTRKHRADIVIPHEQLREAAAIDDGNFEDRVVGIFRKQLGNDWANLVMNGNRSLGAATRLDRSLRGCDGIMVKAAAGANVQNKGGKPFDKAVFAAIRDAVPWEFRNDPDRRWFYNNRISNAYQQALTAVATPLGDAAHTQPTIMPPLGIRPVLCPHIQDDDGPTAIAPTSVADSTTYLTAVLTTLVTAGDPATAALGVGRRFKITCKTTGKSEIVTGYLDTTLKAKTVGLLGQTAGSVSTTNTDYEVRPADETHILYGNPQAIDLVVMDEWRVYREYNKNGDRLEITIYMELDVLFPVPESWVMFTNIAAPPITW